MKLSQEEISNIISKQFGSESFRIQEISSGVMTFKYQIQIGDEYFILRVYPLGRQHIAIKEFEILNDSYNRGCKVPQPLFMEVKGSLAYIIYEMLPGKALSNSFDNLPSKDQLALSKDIVSNIHALSKIQYQGFGGVGENETLYSSWKEFLQIVITNGKGYLDHSNILDSYTKSRLNYFMTSTVDSLDHKIPSLVWSDFSVGNIIIDKNRLAGLIDFEGCMLGDPVLALGYLYAIEGESNFFLSIRESFAKYFKIESSIITFYSFVRFYRLLKYVNQPLPTGAKRENVLEYFKGLKSSLQSLN